MLGFVYKPDKKSQIPESVNTENNQNPNEGAEGSEILTTTVEDFRTQLSAVKKIDYIHPETKTKYQINYTEVGEDVSHPPIIFIGGWGTEAMYYWQEIASLVSYGRRVLFFNPEYGIPNTGFDSQSDLPILMQDKASEMIAAIQSLGLSEYDISGHSQGAIVASAMVSINPEGVKKLLLDNPAGVVQQTHNQLFTRGKAEYDSEKKYIADYEAKNESDAIMLRDFYSKIFRSKAWLTLKTFRLRWREMKAIANTQLIDVLETVVANNGGLEITMVRANDDNLFPGYQNDDEIIERLSGKIRLSSYANPRVGHSKLQVKSPTNYFELFESKDNLQSPLPETESIYTQALN